MEIKKRNALISKTTKSLVTAAAILAICIISQFFKNTSVFITGPIINACLVIATLTSSWQYGLILSIILPITSYFITGSPIIGAVPVIMPLIMLGNTVMILFVDIFTKRTKSGINVLIGSLLGAIVKGLVMGVTISNLAIPFFITEASPLFKKIDTFKFTFSTAQIITGLIGGVLAYLIWMPLKKAWVNIEK